MSSFGVVVFRNSSLAKSQVLQDSVNNSVNITNNDENQNVRREIIVVRKKQKLAETISVTSLVNGSDSLISNVAAKRPRIKDQSGDETSRAPTPLAVARRNARERNRVRQVNDGFAALRRHIPEEVAATFEQNNSNRGPNKKLSKVETLRMAVEYIRNLESLLNIGHIDKENMSARPSMDSFPSPASSSPRDNSQERSYFSINSPALDEDDIEDEDIDGSIHQLPQSQYMDIPVSETFQLVSTPHLYDEEETVGPPLTPSSDLIAQDDVSPHLLDGRFQFPNSAEQFTVIPDQTFCENNISVSRDFEIKYAPEIQQIQSTFSSDAHLPLDTLNSELIHISPSHSTHEQYKFKEDIVFHENLEYNDLELKKELPDIHVTPEDREQFEETLKWWQEKTRQSRPLSKKN